MKIDNIEITKQPAQWRLHIESGGFTFDGFFDDLISFMVAVGGAIKYFGMVHGLLGEKKDGSVYNRGKR